MLSSYFLFVVVHFVCTVLLLKALRSFFLPAIVTCWFFSCADLVACLLIAKLAFPFTKRRVFGGKVHPHNKAVLVTGCDHGFGHMLAKQLACEGFHVFAGCLDSSGGGAAELQKYCTQRLEVLKLDVTNDENVKEAVDFVKERLGTSDLWAVVNNAGILRGLSVDFTPLQYFKDCMDVNVFGTVRVIKAFLPLLKQSRGRIVNVTSVGGKITIPYITAYLVSKFGAVGLSECLRQELNVFGIRVISVEPEIYRTQLYNWIGPANGFDEIFDSLSDDVKASYGDEYFKKFTEAEAKFTVWASTKFENVVHDLVSAVSLKYPDVIYRPCRSFVFCAILYCYERLPIITRDFLMKWIAYLFGLAEPKYCRKW